MAEVTIPYKPREWALTLHESDKRWKVIVAHRRSGKTTSCINHLIRDALLTQNSRYAYIAPTYKQAKNVAWDMLKFYSRVIPGVSFNEAELRADYPNGSRITLFGADNPDSLRGIGLWGVVFDEYSQQPSNIFSEIIRPALADHSGYAIWIGCVTGDTKVLQKSGVKNIIDYKTTDEKYTDIHETLYGKGWNNADGFFINGKVKTKKIVTDKGFSIEGSTVHKLLTNGEWKELQHFQIGDTVDIAHGMEVWGGENILKGFEFTTSRHANSRIHDTSLPNKMNNDFAYFLGLWLAEGSVEQDIHRFTITCGDRVEIEQFGFRKVRNDQWRINSQELHKMMQHIGMPLTTAPHKFLPNAIWRMTREQVQHLLGGYFDGDGHTKNMRKELVFTSSSRQLMSDIQLLCSNFGAIGRITEHITPPTERVGKECIAYRLMFTGEDYERVVGFIKPRITRKAKKIEDTKSLKRYSSYKQKRGKYVSDTIVSIEDGEAETYDFTIPKTHSYWSNGFISHNTPKGKNNFWELYEHAKQDEQWLALLRTADDTDIISEEELEDAKRIMSDDEFQQEFYCSFEAAIQGAYYGKQVSKAREEGRITDVPYDELLPVHTWWDLGVGDATAIIFLQHYGKEWRMIDCYEASGEGLAHYAHVLKEKGYYYGEHYAPHDIQVRELGTGKSRYDIARSLGIDFKIAPNLPIEDGINVTRMRFNQLWFDEEKCARFLHCISLYRKEWDDKRGEFKNKPLHDFSSHFADALRYWGVSEVKDEDETRQYRPSWISRKSTI